MVSISHVCVHHGEEPVISGSNGIVNVFFTGCNMRCIYCQNYQISQEGVGRNSVADPVRVIAKLLDEGCDTVGFVSPSHCVSSVKELIAALNQCGYNPITVYNSNGYDSVSKLQEIEGLIDVYLPDLKYATNELGRSLSNVGNYADVATKAIKEMYRQKGSMLIRDEQDKALSGLIIRHLVLPGYVDNSLQVLDIIANEISTSVHLSIMAQYNPTPNVDKHSTLSRCITAIEYEQVKRYFEVLGFRKGWFQELDSSQILNPDFTKEVVF